MKDHAQVLDDLRALCRVRAEVERQVDQVAECALRSGADRSTVAYILGISRSHLYRKYTGRFRPISGEGVRNVSESKQVQELRTVNQGD